MSREVGAIGHDGTSTAKTARKALAATRDAAVAIQIAFQATGPGLNLLAAWLYVPFGLVVILAFCFAVHVGLSATGVEFPASVACLILLFLALLLSQVIMGAHRTRLVVNLIDVPAGWALRWINILFTPSFILLPLSPSIGIGEVGKIIAVFCKTPVSCS